MVSTPKPESAASQAAAQQGLNQSTATTQQLLNQTNQITPYGNLTYQQTGTNSYVDSNGKTVTLPQFTATTTLSPDQQKILASSNKASQNLADLASQQSGFLKNYLANPYKGESDFNFDNQDAANYSYDLATQRILPQQQKDTEALKAQLVASGIRPGTAAYNSEMQRLSQSNTDQLNQLALNSQSQAYNQALQAYQQNAQTHYQNYTTPLNTVSSLLGGTQITNPNFVSTPQTQVAGADYIGASQNNYNQQVSAANAMNGGLFGLLSAGVKAIPFSDRRLKRAIKLIGEKVGLPWYSFQYVWSDDLKEGFMADDVIKVIPEHVHKEGEYFWVDYDAILEAA